MGKIILIPGLGADGRIYQRIKAGSQSPVLVEWFIPNSRDTLGSYAEKIISQFNIMAGDVVIGNSLGGMLAVEIANRVKVDKVILISSIKTVNEAPWYFPMFRGMPIYKAMPGFVLTRLGRLARLIFGRMSKAENNLFVDMLRRSSPVFMRWAMYAVLHWQNKTIPENLYHITGDKDLIFDYRRISNATIVKGGTHIMIFDRADEINEILKKILAIENI